MTISPIGLPIEALDTPTLLVDLDILERNLQRMKRIIMDEAGIAWRPHTKGMKTPTLAHMLMRAGAHGITCAKLGEAEVMAAGGVQNILIANQVVGPLKAKRLARLQRSTSVLSCVDSECGAAFLGAAAIAEGTRVPVVIEVDTGMGRAGVLPGDATVDLAKRVDQIDGVELVGLMTWEAAAAKEADIDAKRAAATRMLTGLTESADACRAAGLNMEIVTCGGTLTYWFSAFHPGVTEMQAGGGIYGDAMYCHKYGVDHEFALTIKSTVTSRPTPRRIICDAGKKTMSADVAWPIPQGIGDVAEMKQSAEHGIIELVAPSDTPAVGDHLHWIAGYSDTTVFLHNELVATRGGIVEAVWPLLGRGKLT
ncbi:MAG: DSD1 family PLP-dependent enzyme [Gemmatimonadetes bacterium]|nr:DSD1 family PLP-dependent enzyme [Gemmatimonadota bacterium]MBT4099921.1 DSD1 family PLP-dependent enzyme [Gemmatimonadota bacterium]MBT5059709.1 DSD1 family PLP-dependent enzyme [Gemmatimonadota bacterium]MBT5146175.1 DSD1 family PLP-dependent enzyme [Gemmatimonadota bacterium]MBT5590818.1 DSD1 family PLP-dependent enzyme [Gemmatimonadota bacterium]